MTPSCRTFPIAFLLLLSGLSLRPLSASEQIILVTSNKTTAEKTEVIGARTLLNKEASPASTFKIVLTWLALEEGIGKPETRFVSKDKHVPGTPREIDLREAMYYSSNDYFLQLIDAKAISIENVKKRVEASRFFERPLPKVWPPGEFKSIVAGGDQTVTPGYQHTFILRVMRGELSSSSKVQDQLLKCLAWPSSSPDWKFYGKTGSHASLGAFWFTGFGISEKLNEKRAVTVFMTGKGANRDATIKLFYEQWNLPPPAL
jgi:beta-lactamase class D